MPEFDWMQALFDQVFSPGSFEKDQLKNWKKKERIKKPPMELIFANSEEIRWKSIHVWAALGIACVSGSLLLPMVV